TPAILRHRESAIAGQDRFEGLRMGGIPAKAPAKTESGLRTRPPASPPGGAQPGEVLGPYDPIGIVAPGTVRGPGAVKCEQAPRGPAPGHGLDEWAQRGGEIGRVRPEVGGGPGSPGHGGEQEGRAERSRHRPPPPAPGRPGSAGHPEASLAGLSEVAGDTP